MESVGIIAEYNPFHLGHQLQIKKVKELYPEACIVILMSGNLVQRGEFAIIDKWTRSQAAVQGGADLILELPVVATLQAADYFADWSVFLLNQLSIENMVFGTESARTHDLYLYLDLIQTHEELIDQEVRASLDDGNAYPQAYNDAIKKLLSKQLTFNPSTSNHILAIQYLKSHQKQKSSFTLHGLPRFDHDPMTQKYIISGSQIRAKMLKHETYDEDIPKVMWNLINDNSVVSWADYYPYLQYQLTLLSSEELARINGIDEGIEYYLKDSFSTKENYDTFLNQLVTKRYTKASLNRKLMSILLNYQRSDWDESLEANREQPLLRVLAYSSKGQEFLNLQRNNHNIHLFSNLRQEFSHTYKLNLKADRIYQLNQRSIIQEQIQGRYPYYHQKA